jgi:hypothetical protein
VTLDYSAATNPVINLYWPQNNTAVVGNTFTLRGWTEDAVAQVTAQIVNTNGNTNIINGEVEREGTLWVENLPLSSGTNWLTLWVTNAAGYIERNEHRDCPKHIESDDQSGVRAICGSRR